MTAPAPPTPPSYALAEMLRQADALAEDLRTGHGPALQQVRGLPFVGEQSVISRVYLVGSGDSYHAALATQMAFHRLAGVACEPLSALRMLEYGAAWEYDDALPSGTLVIGISASGGNQRLIQALERAGEQGARTLAITATAHSPLTRASDHTVTLPLSDLKPCPGIRTYQASLLGLLLTAIELGRQRGHPSAHAEVLNREVLATADAIEATTAALRPRCDLLADRIAGAPVTMALGSGPGYGSALFAAAKLIEAAGVFAAGQDLEEWEHVEVLARPRDMPTVVIAAPGRSRDRALQVATRAHGYGRTVIAVAGDGDRGLAEAANVVLPLHGTVREEFSALVSHLFAGPLACFVAERLERLPFATNRP
ncbi:SIS domain-containing protein (plasmid) [Streptosporangium sp. NBC_01495]|uniref:SIS domain-containing protein n=1 Tax=Streptosporangium sp. NBC_01495 TaxID=2903899 RepID=UPI002E36233B|nr:SIS domain-containing protein [Streptosporangium sp. NBC_01495]